MMAQKTSTLYARINPKVKEKAERILAELGIPASTAVDMFYRQIIMHRGLPFEAKLTPRRLPDISDMSSDEFFAALEDGYADIEKGNERPIANAFASIAEDYGI